jgi:hypothetical protein
LGILRVFHSTFSTAYTLCEHLGFADSILTMLFGNIILPTYEQLSPQRFDKCFLSSTNKPSFYSQILDLLFQELISKIAKCEVLPYYFRFTASPKFEDMFFIALTHLTPAKMSLRGINDA